MKEIISLKEFALTGNLGPVKIGMTKTEVIDLLGEGYGDNAYGTGASGLNYGWYEIFYWSENELVFAFQNDHLRADCSNHDEMILFENGRFKVDTWFLEVGRSFRYNEVKEILQKEGISFLEKPDHHDDRWHLILQSGVAIDFDNRDWVDHLDDQRNVREREEVPITSIEDHVLNGIRYYPDTVYPS